LLTWTQTITDNNTYSVTFSAIDNAATCTSTTLNAIIDGPAANDTNESVSTTSCLDGTFNKLFSNDTGDWYVDDVKTISDDTVDSTAPTAPSVVGVLNGQQVTLTIAKGTDNGVGLMSYEVFRDDCAGGAYTSIDYVLDDYSRRPN
jgi:hypothetical protein